MLFIFSRNSAILVHGLCLVVQLRPIQINRAELQYWTQYMDKSSTAPEEQRCI